MLQNFSTLPLLALLSLGQGEELATRPQFQVIKDTTEIVAKLIGRYVQGGVAVEVSIVPIDQQQSATPRIVEEDNVQIRVSLSDAETGTPRPDLTIAGWIDRRPGEAASEREACRARIESYIQGSMRVRPVVDLNSYYILALNQGNSISVIDPFLGFGTSKLYTRVLLRSEGEDWVVDSDRERLYVTLPRVNTVAVVNTGTWKVEKEIEVGVRPVRAVFQPDRRMLWIGNDGVAGGVGGVTAIDPTTREVVATIPTGVGHHEFAFSDDSRSVFVTNKDDGTLSIIDIATLTKTVSLKVGEIAADVAYSSLNKRVYTVSEDGVVMSLDVANQTVRGRFQGAPGLTSLRFDPSGRWGFIVNSQENTVYILDAAADSVRHTLEVGETPYQVAFSASFAYIRSKATSSISMIPLDELEHGDAISMWPFPAGQIPPDQFGGAGFAEAITAAPDKHDGVYIANPGEKTIYAYHFMEGMPTPSGTLNNYGLEPKAVLTVGRSLRETSPGIFTTTIKAPKNGEYDVVFLLEDPRIIHCFAFSVEESPEVQADEPIRPRVRLLAESNELQVGSEVSFAFELTSEKTGEPLAGIADLGVLLTSPTGAQVRARAIDGNAGRYTVTVTIRDPGLYYLFISSRSRGFRVQDQRPVTLRAVQ